MLPLIFHEQVFYEVFSFLTNTCFTNLDDPHELTLDHGPCFGCQYFLFAILQV